MVILDYNDYLQLLSNDLLFVVFVFLISFVFILIFPLRQGLRFAF